MYPHTNPESQNHLGGLSEAAHDLQNKVTPLIDRATEKASALAQRGVDAVRDSSEQLRQQALRVSDGTRDYIRDEPVKSMLIAAATGAALMALLSMMGRSSNHRRG